MTQNYLGLRGIEFTEFASADTDYMAQVFKAFGFSKTRQFKGKAIDYYNQHDIHFLLNRERTGFSAEFAKQHGPAICSMGWRVDNAVEARRIAIEFAIPRGFGERDERFRGLSVHEHGFDVRAAKVDAD